MGNRKGFKFNLKDGEIMKCLLNKVTGASWLGWCCDEDIESVDLYGDEEPWVVFGNRGEGEKERYFFTPLKGVGKGEQRVCRSVGKVGSWSNKGQKALIFGQKGAVIGHRRGFRYEVKKGRDNSESDYDWLLKEYVLSDIAKRRVKRKYASGANCALCVLKRRMKKNKVSPVVEEEGEEEEESDDEWFCQQFGGSDDDDGARGASSCSSLQQAVGDVEEDDRSLCVPVEDTRGAELPFLPMEDSSSCGLPQVSEWLLEEDQLEYWSIPVEEDASRSCLQEMDDWRQNKLIAEECSAPPPPPVDSSSSSLSEGGQKGGADTDDFNFAFGLEDNAAAAAPSNDHFACWDDDGDLFADYRFPWATGMLPVSVV